ncbi:Sec-independent protein translocase protein TatB [Candidatus Finniella inopinata]|uniref:Twin-arginine translocase subunit TatB n=1 Tax=Candidatus Finniella inopinata TaxID=1696036 RepID=A0A4Q7DI44_9PROT|nr:Sec-independent protein translocase protein TatB [Candidatus Finniella inopinata]RZI46372.1 twin-arginine translocase subunit TatB [Candidatus Finniella inopinata]
MFDVAWTEYLLVVVVALVLLGPKELPVVLRTLGRWVAKARQMTNSLEQQLHSLDDPRPASALEEPKKAIFTYQRVFFKQHHTSSRTFQRVNPYPNPWL